MTHPASVPTLPGVSGGRFAAMSMPASAPYFLCSVARAVSVMLGDIARRVVGAARPNLLNQSGYDNTDTHEPFHAVGAELLHGFDDAGVPDRWLPSRHAMTLRRSAT